MRDTKIFTCLGESDKEKEREKEEGETEERKREERPAFRFSTQSFLSQDLIPRSAHHGVRRGEARVHVEGRAGRNVWARDDVRHRAWQGKTE